MYYLKINKNFVHQVGNQPKLYYDARSTNHQVIFHFIFCTPHSCMAGTVLLLHATSQ